MVSESCHVNSFQLVIYKILTYGKYGDLWEKYGKYGDLLEKYGKYGDLLEKLWKYGDLLEKLWEIWWFIGKNMGNMVIYWKNMGNKRWFMQSVWQTSTNHPIVHFSMIGLWSFRRKKCHSKICHRCLMSRPSSLSSRNDSWTAIPLDHQKKLHVLIQRMYFRFYLAIAWFGPFIKKTLHEKICSHAEFRDRVTEQPNHQCDNEQFLRSKIGNAVYFSLPGWWNLKLNLTSLFKRNIDCRAK